MHFTAPRLITSAMTAIAVLASMAVISAQTTSIRLFDAIPVTDSGPVTSPSQAITFAETALVLQCPASPSGVLSSTSDGVGNLVVDNFITVDGTNVCAGGLEGPVDHINCFTSFAGSLGDPAGTAYGGVPAIDISSSLAPDRHLVTFALLDFGAVLANTDIYLTTNCRVSAKVDICHKPGTSAQHTIQVAQSAVKAHLSHGDQLGPCQ